MWADLLVFDYMDEPLDSVLSEDIWNKFDFDAPLEVPTVYERYYEEPIPHEPMLVTLKPGECQEIRHHDCMWAGLCISHEHDETKPLKKDCQMTKKIGAGKSVLRPAIDSTQQQSKQQHHHHHQETSSHRMDSLESDGDSTRPETPQSSESDSDSECDAPIFKHDQISINEKLSECMLTKAAPVSEVTGQLVRSTYMRRKAEATTSTPTTPTTTSASKETEIRNTLSDHCYHINQEGIKRLEHLGVQTPSDSGELSLFFFIYSLFSKIKSFF